MWPLFISFIVALFLVLLLSRLCSRWLLELLGERWYVFVLWPGVVIHELSHLVAAVFTFTKVTGISLIPKLSGGGRELGSVTHESVKDPFRLILISAFPFVGSAAVIWLLTVLLLPKAPLGAPIIPPINEWWQIIDYFQVWLKFVGNLWQAFDVTMWQSWLWLYLLICLAAHLAPSGHDLNYTATGLAVLTLLVILVVALVSIFYKSINLELQNYLVGFVQTLVPLVSFTVALLMIVGWLVGIAVSIKRLNSKVDW